LWFEPDITAVLTKEDALLFHCHPRRDRGSMVWPVGFNFRSRPWIPAFARMTEVS